MLLCFSEYSERDDPMTTELERLTSIRRLMADTQRRVEDYGDQFVAWGLLTAAGMLVTYAALVVPLRTVVVTVTWPALVVVGWVGWLLRGRRAHARAPVRSVGDDALRDLWGGVGVGVLLLAFVGRATGAIPAVALPGTVAALTGVGFFASAPFYGALPLRWIAAAWWGGAALMLTVRGPYTLLLAAGMAIALEVVPGLVLRRRRHELPASGEA